MMRRWTVASTLLCIAALAAAFVVAGCSKPQATPGSNPPVSKALPTAAPTATPAATEEMASCPVLGTTMPKSQMIKEEYKGKTYYLCCQDCVPKFKADPEKYTKNPAKPLPADAGMPH
jgi:YHS domain-containing protein